MLGEHAGDLGLPEVTCSCEAHLLRADIVRTREPRGSHTPGGHDACDGRWMLLKALAAEVMALSQFCCYTASLLLLEVSLACCRPGI